MALSCGVTLVEQTLNDDKKNPKQNQQENELMTDAWPAPSDTAAPAADGWNGTRADRSPPPHVDRERQRDRSRSPGRNGEDRGRPNAGGGGGGANPGNNLHVSGLSSRVDNRMLDEAFGKFGKVAKAAVVYDPHSRESRGFAFVTMESVEEAEAAIAALHNSELAGKPITVEKARRGRARTPTPGKYLGTARREDRGHGSYRDDRYAAERPYYPRYLGEGSMTLGTLHETGTIDTIGTKGTTGTGMEGMDTIVADTMSPAVGMMRVGADLETTDVGHGLTETAIVADMMIAVKDNSPCTKIVLGFQFHEDPALSEDNREELVDAPFDERMQIPALPSLSAAKRCLLVLDLNGTLLHRRRTNSGHTSHIYVRPYLGAFLQYISHPSAFLDVAVWSSARRANVDLMVDSAWTGRKPEIVLAREDMQLTDRQFRRAYRRGTFHPDHNVRTTKDLRQLWLRLAQAQAQAQVHTQSGVTLMHGPRDTILLDDSIHKARLQPNNHLALPTYGSEQLRADADALVSGSETVDESLIAVVGILSELRVARVPVDDWTRTGRVWAGPGAKLDMREMWDGRIRPCISPAPPPASSSRSLTSLTNQTELNRANQAGSSLSSRLASRVESPVVEYEPDPPFEPSQHPRIYNEMPQWFTSPPLMRAWVEHGRRVLDGLGIRIEHECVQAWPGWREGKHEIWGRAKDDVPKEKGKDDAHKDRKEKRRKEWATKRT
ncbi:unnamed protein product [Rhizoctonia solani]|uniref:Uncharacterized protein n=1 Tax=Rhizoctonia solani TaxID=456999 RepID=A0A8H2X4U8_9AGAM|nr:unnamed protein product [Rhizoctonia solani]